MRKRQQQPRAKLSEYQLASIKQGIVCRVRKFPPLDVVEQVYPDAEQLVTYTSHEFNSLCPKTGLPDFADAVIIYRPSKYLVELKSLKLYLNSFRNVGIFQEHAANKVFEDFWAAARPRYLKVDFHFGARGGIDTRIVREREA